MIRLIPLFMRKNVLARIFDSTPSITALVIVALHMIAHDNAWASMRPPAQ